jgi:hypothetical protein
MPNSGNRSLSKAGSSAVALSSVLLVAPHQMGAARAVVLALLPVGPVPGVPGAPNRSDLIDRFSAADFVQVLEKDWNRFHPMTVAVDHRMLQTVMNLFSSIIHGIAPLASINFAADYCPGSIYKLSAGLLNHNIKCVNNFFGRKRAMPITRDRQNCQKRAFPFLRHETRVFVLLLKWHQGIEQVVERDQRVVQITRRFVESFGVGHRPSVGPDPFHAGIECNVVKRAGISRRPIVVRNAS